MKKLVIDLMLCCGICPDYSLWHHGCRNKKVLRKGEQVRMISKRRHQKNFPAWCPLEEVEE